MVSNLRLIGVPSSGGFSIAVCAPTSHRFGVIGPENASPRGPIDVGSNLLLKRLQRHIFAAYFRRERAVWLYNLEQAKPSQRREPAET